MKHYKNGNKKFFSYHVPGSTRSRIYAGKSAKRGFSPTSNDEKKNLTHFSDSTHQDCMVFASIGHGSCYHHWNEIFGGVMFVRVKVCNYVPSGRPTLKQRAISAYAVF